MTSVAPVRLLRFVLTSRRCLPTVPPTPVRAKMAHVLIVCTLVCAIGGQWVILQSVAWVGMAVSYSRDSTLTEALLKTFDGQHPCKLCKVVQEGKNAEKKRNAQKQFTKLDLFVAVHPATVLFSQPASIGVERIGLTTVG